MKPKVGIVDYRMGNIASLRNAFLAIEADVFVAQTPDQLLDATHIVLPGVGAFPKGMENLRMLGFEAALRRLVLAERWPFLGVCLGMQLLASLGEEHRICEGLGLIPGRVTLLQAPSLRIPHVGWNDTVSLRDNTLLGASGKIECFYYVHSFHLIPEDPADAAMSCMYGQTFAAGVQRDNIFGVQFHPEKSHARGLAVLKRFTEVSVVKETSDTVPVPAERSDSP